MLNCPSLACLKNKLYLVRSVKGILQQVGKYTYSLSCCTITIHGVIDSLLQVLAWSKYVLNYSFILWRLLIFPGFRCWFVAVVDCVKRCVLQSNIALKSLCWYSPKHLIIPVKSVQFVFYLLAYFRKSYILLVDAPSKWSQNGQFLYFNHSGFKYGNSWHLWHLWIYYVLFNVEWTKCRNQRLMVLQVVLTLLNHSHTSDTFKSDNLFLNCILFWRL